MLTATAQVDTVDSSKVGTVSDQISKRKKLLEGKAAFAHDTVQSRINSVKLVLQQCVDSLHQKSESSQKLQHTLDSINALAETPTEEYQKLISYQQKLQQDLKEKIPLADTVAALHVEGKEKINSINEVSSELGIGPLGKDLKADIDPKLPSLETPSVDPDMSGLETHELNLANTQLETGLPSFDIPDIQNKLPDLNSEIPNEAEQLKASVDKISGTAQEVAGIVKEGNMYLNEAKTIQEEGVARSEKLDELAEQQVGRIDGVQTLQQQEAQIDQYKSLIEQYKKEKAIEEEMKKKSKELANDLFAQNQAKVDESLKKVNKYKRKLSVVDDLRNLRKDAANPMKGLSWRDRVSPGFTLHTINSGKLWIQLDPQVSYKVSGRWSAGMGGMYRFSMDPGKITFSEFNNLFGYKAFVDCHLFKGFFLRAEGQRLTWAPQFPVKKDPGHIDNITVASAGIGKSYMIAKRIKGNAQTLYHYSWGPSDPYKSKIIIRFGFDFGLQKKEKKPWEDKLKALKRKGKRAD
jgi:hypothetical protein